MKYVRSFPINKGDIRLILPLCEIRHNSRGLGAIMINGKKEEDDGSDS